MRSQDRLAIRRAFGGSSYTFESDVYDSDVAIRFRKQLDFAIEWSSAMNRELNWDGTNGAVRNARLFAPLQTEAAINPSGIGHTDDPTRLAGSIADEQFDSMGTNCLVAQVLPSVLDNQRISMLLAITEPDHAKTAPNNQAHGDE